MRLIASDALRQQRMRADDEPDRATGKARLHALRLGGLGEPRKLPDLDAEAPEAPGEGVHVLAHEHRGRREDRHLLAGENRRSRGAERDLGLAVADIAADEAIHRAAGGEIGERISDGTGLVRRLGEGEARGEALVFWARPVELHAGRALALPRLFDEPSRGPRDVLLEFDAALLPGIAVEPVKRDPFALAGIAPDAVHLVDRRKELVVVLEG